MDHSSAKMGGTHCRLRFLHTAECTAIYFAGRSVDCPHLCLANSGEILKHATQSIQPSHVTDLQDVVCQL